MKMNKRQARATSWQPGKTIAARRAAALAVLLAAALAAPAGSAATAEVAGDWETLTAGVRVIDAPGVPGPLSAFGPEAFAVALGRGGANAMHPVVAAAPWEAGRVVAFGHTGYLDGEPLKQGDTGRLLTNAVRWAAQAAGPEAEEVRVAVRGAPAAAPFLEKEGFRIVAGEEGDWTASLAAADALVVRPASLHSEEELEAVRRFVRSGGGLVAADLGWGWLQLNPGRQLAEHPGNRLLAEAGIVWADGTLRRTADAGFNLTEPPPPTTAAAAAVAALADDPDGPAASQAWATLLLAVRSVPLDNAILRGQLDALRERFPQQAVPRPDAPLTAADAAARFHLTLSIEEARRLPPEAIPPHPAADAFPGAVAETAPRLERTDVIGPGGYGWQSTGLYAAPGEAIEVSIPAEAAGSGLKVRIGAHSDRLWHADRWRRVPEICHEAPLEQEATLAVNAFGGPVYIDVPRARAAAAVPVTIRGAVAMPHFVLGETTAGAWRTLRELAAPWAELEGERVVLTVPADAVRRLDRPEALMEFWDTVVRACDALAARPPAGRKERYVADVQISAGYMHAGYPIMTHLDAAAVMTDLATLRDNTHGAVWGLFHEMGHNYQEPEWTFAGTGEVTCNLFTLYIYEVACGRPGGFDERFTAEQRRSMLDRHRRGGCDFAQWQRDPFLALLMYVQLQEAFGWEAFQEVFAEYRALPPDARPRNDDEKRDQWLTRMSRTVGHDLGPFFEAWGVPTSRHARAALADLPPWMPAEME